MRYCRFEFEGKPHYGELAAREGHDYIVRLLPPPEEDSAAGHSLRDLTARPLEQARLLAPVAPSKIICVGRNYRDHAKELGNEPPKEILIFEKPISALLAPGEPIMIPRQSQRVDYEGELGIVIGKRCRNIAEEEDVRRYIRGYVCANDVTARDLQKTDSQWTRAKGFDTFCPVGPCVSDQADPWRGLELETRVNGELRQRGNTRDFIFPIEQVIRYIASVMTLCPGDLILTGTPAGVGPVKAGDTVTVSIPGLGMLSNPVQQG